MVSDIVTALLSSPAISAIGIAAMILFFGFRLLAGLQTDSPFSPYAIQILALIVVLPVVLTLALTAKFPTEALTGLLGTIVGFFFGGAHQAPSLPRQQRTGGGQGQGGRTRDLAVGGDAAGNGSNDSPRRPV
jgi:hypothetical protein